jgi:tetratricopeptide (TPR) repeat protein
MLRKSPSSAQLLVLLGQTQAAENKVADAQATFNSVIAQNPKDELGYTVLSGFFAKQKSFAEAITTVQAGLKELPDSLSLRLTWAGLLISKGDNDAAIAAYEAILRDRPNTLLAVNNLANLLIDNRTDKASLEHATVLSDALKASNVPQFRDTVGWLEYKLGKTAEATQTLEAVTKQAPNLAAARYHLGMSYAAAGQVAQATEQFKTALNLEPEGTELKDKIRAAIK